MKIKETKLSPQAARGLKAIDLYDPSINKYPVTPSDAFVKAWKHSVSSYVQGQLDLIERIQDTIVGAIEEEEGITEDIVDMIRNLKPIEDYETRTAKDGYAVHRSGIMGTQINDPNRTASLIPSIYGM